MRGHGPIITVHRLHGFRGGRWKRREQARTSWTCEILLCDSGLEIERARAHGASAPPHVDQSLCCQLAELRARARARRAPSGAPPVRMMQASARRTTSRRGPRAGLMSNSASAASTADARQRVGSMGVIAYAQPDFSGARGPAEDAPSSGPSSRRARAQRSQVHGRGRLPLRRVLRRAPRRSRRRVPRAPACRRAGCRATASAGRAPGAGPAARRGGRRCRSGSRRSAPTGRHRAAAAALHSAAAHLRSSLLPRRQRRVGETHQDPREACVGGRRRSRRCRRFQATLEPKRSSPRRPLGDAAPVRPRCCPTRTVSGRTAASNPSATAALGLFRCGFVEAKASARHAAAANHREAVVCRPALAAARGSHGGGACGFRRLRRDTGARRCCGCAADHQKWLAREAWPHSSQCSARLGSSAACTGRAPRAAKTRCRRARIRLFVAQ